MSLNNCFVQPWGVAFRGEDGIYKWCYNNGPNGQERLTKRASLMSTLMSNNGFRSGPYVPVPLVDVAHSDLKDMEPFRGGRTRTSALPSTGACRSCSPTSQTSTTRICQI